MHHPVPHDSELPGSALRDVIEFVLAIAATYGVMFLLIAALKP